MGDSSVEKVEQATAPRGELGQTYLASGTSVALRLWEAVAPGTPKPAVARDYETVGYVLSGRARLHLEGQVVDLEAKTSWVVPKGAEHTYEILEAFTAVEATHPPAQAHGRDERPADRADEAQANDPLQGGV